MTTKQSIYLVARTMAEADEVDPTGGRTLDEWREFNAAAGFSFEARLNIEGPGNWSRIEGLQLSPAHLEEAYRLAEEMTGLQSVPQAAAYLGVTPRRVLALIEEGRLPAERVGGRFVIRNQDLTTYRPQPTGRPRKVS